MTFCPDCFHPLDVDAEERFVCGKCKDVIKDDVALDDSDLSVETRALAAHREKTDDEVVAIVRMGHELPADVVAALSRIAPRFQPCSMCGGKRLGSRVDGVGSTYACPPCRKLSFSAIGGAA